MASHAESDYAWLLTKRAMWCMAFLCFLMVVLKRTRYLAARRQMDYELGDVYMAPDRATMGRGITRTYGPGSLPR